MGLNVAQMSNTDRLAEILNRSKTHFGPEGKQMVDALLSTENLIILVGTLGLWAGSHLFGVGEIVDVLLLIVGAFAIGWSIKDVAENIYTFANLTINARTEPELDKAAKAFSHAVILAGVTTIMALLLRRSVKQIQATRGVNVLDAMKPRYKPGLPRLSASDPEPNSWWSKPGFVSDSNLPANQGLTVAFGEVRVSTLGTTEGRMLALYHELVHRFLKPRFLLFRTFRVRLSASGYLRSALLKYLEEALAETYAQLRVNGLSGVITGIRFPLANGGITIRNGVILGSKVSQGMLLSEGASIGTIIVGTEYFAVQFNPVIPEMPDLICYVDEPVCR